MRQVVMRRFVIRQFVASVAAASLALVGCAGPGTGAGAAASGGVSAPAGGANTATGNTATAKTQKASAATGNEASAATGNEAGNDAARSGSAAGEGVAVPAGGPGWLGVELAKREAGAPGVLVRGVMRGSPAARAGLEGGDVVMSVDGQGVGRPTELHDLIVSAGSGKRVSLGVLRGDTTRLFAVDLEQVPNDDEVMRRNYVGARAPDFGALDTVQGSVTPTLAGLSGRVVVLEFWASWCGPCHVMAPTLQGWHDRYSAQGVTVLGVTNDPMDVAGRAAGELGIGYPVARDGTGSMVRAYRAYALPTLFVIDKRGNVRDVLIGYSTPRLREIEALVKKLIAEG
jgi:thiol-disulfide isomerase/thioredoxin